MQAHYMYLQMDLLDNPLSTRPSQTGRECCIEPYPNGLFRLVDNPDRQFGTGSVPTRTQTRSDGPETLLTVSVSKEPHLHHSIDYDKYIASNPQAIQISTIAVNDTNIAEKSPQYYHMWLLHFELNKVSDLSVNKKYNKRIQLEISEG